MLRWPHGAGLALSIVLNIEEGAEFSVTSGDPGNEAVHEMVHEIAGVRTFVWKPISNRAPATATAGCLTALCNVVCR